MSSAANDERRENSHGDDNMGVVVSAGVRDGFMGSLTVGGLMSGTARTAFETPEETRLRTKMFSLCSDVYNTHHGHRNQQRDALQHRPPAGAQRLSIRPSDTLVANANNSANHRPEDRRRQLSACQEVGARPIYALPPSHPVSRGALKTDAINTRDSTAAPFSSSPSPPSPISHSPLLPPIISSRGGGRPLVTSSQGNKRVSIAAEDTPAAGSSGFTDQIGGPPRHRKSSSGGNTSKPDALGKQQRQPHEWADPDLAVMHAELADLLAEEAFDEAKRRESERMRKAEQCTTATLQIQLDALSDEADHEERRVAEEQILLTALEAREWEVRQLKMTGCDVSPFKSKKKTLQEIQNTV